MFGIGGSEILVILVIALLFLGPDKLPEAAKVISKTVRDLKKQGRILTQTIENDEHIGGAIRDLKSALRGDEIPVRPPPKKLGTPTIATPEDLAKVEAAEATAALAESKSDVESVIAEANIEAKVEAAHVAATAPAPAAPTVTLPPTAGEVDATATAPAPADDTADREELAKLVKPAAGSVARDVDSDRNHG